MQIRATFALVAACVLALAGCSHGDSDSSKSICLEQSAGTTSDGDSVTVCQKIFKEAPFVRLPGDDTSAATVTINGAVDLDIRESQDTPGKWLISAARFVDRNLKIYELANPDGTPVTEASTLMAANHLPSNRVHFLAYEAKGTLSGTQLRLASLKPIVMITGRAIDERFLGSWEGTMSLYEGEDWSPTSSAKVRVEMAALVPHDPIHVVTTVTPVLADGTRFKAVGGVANGDTRVKLSTGECVASLRSFGVNNPLFRATDTLLTLWRFPVMHTAASRDYHVVLDYPHGLYDAAMAMAPDHNFHMFDYISPKTAPMDLRFVIHGNPVGQIEIDLKPVTGGGDPC
jgi:hypothetical protein